MTTRFWTFLTLAAALAACSPGGSDKAPDGSEVAGKSFSGSAADGTLVTMSFYSEVNAPAARMAAVAAGSTLDAEGSIQLPSGDVIQLTGTYVIGTYTVTLTGGSFTITGTWAGGVFQGTMVDGTAVARVFVAVEGDTLSVTQYCGTFTTALDETGVFNLTVAGTKAFAVVESADGGMVMTGTVSGSSITLVDPRGRDVPGTISGDSVSGTFTNNDGPGTWSGSTGACQPAL